VTVRIGSPVRGVLPQLGPVLTATSTTTVGDEIRGHAAIGVAQQATVVPVRFARAECHRETRALPGAVGARAMTRASYDRSSKEARYQRRVPAPRHLPPEHPRPTFRV
jgi:hypothetical protein